MTDFWNKLSLLQRFSNLPISCKQLIALVASELISILGLGIVGRFLIASNLQTLSLEQAKSELTVTDIAYNIKVNQMGFGFRGQSDNTAVIEAANIYSLGQKINNNLRSEVRQILQNEIKARKIEYATLVGKDFKIIVNANADRTGEFFNPDNLVSEVFKYPRQIKANKIVNWTELSKEAPILPENFKNQDALIRYTVTPVREPNTEAVIGALVSGDIVNGKNPIVKETLKGTGGGYSAVYLRKPTGDFTLATSLNQAKSKGINEAQANVPLPQEGISLLKEAAQTNGGAVTGRIQVGDRIYAMAAKAIPNKIIEADNEQIPVFGEQPIAILVRGTPENTLNQLLERSFWVELLAVIIALAIISFWALMMRKTIIKPIQQLLQTAQKFAAGFRSGSLEEIRAARSEVFSTDEIGKLSATFNDMADRITEQVRRQENEVKLAHSVHDITSAFRGVFNTTQILNAVVTSTREAIKADRILVYTFNENWSGKVLAESVSANFPAAIGADIDDPCFNEDCIEKYRRGFVLKIENIYEAPLSECYLAQLERLAVKANLVTPIVFNNKVYGLLIAHQCSASRKWQDLEINLLKQVTIAVGYALEQASLLEQVDTISRSEIVTKVKQSATQVNTALVNNKRAIAHLTEEILKQANEINRTQGSLEQITLAMVLLRENAQKASLIAQTSSHTAVEIEAAINLNVQNLFYLRSTISNIANKIKLFGEYLPQIYRIVSLINQIATQTKLLALNAEVEVDRNSDSNGGAVIAAEVSELAVRCANASQEIEKIVENIQQVSNEVLKAIEQGTTHVVESTNLAEQGKAPLSLFLELSHQIDELVQSISQTTVSQVEMSQRFTQRMKDISQMSEFTSNSAQQISQSLQQTVEICQELQAMETFKQPLK